MTFDKRMTGGGQKTGPNGTLPQMIATQLQQLTVGTFWQVTQSCRKNHGINSEKMQPQIGDNATVIPITSATAPAIRHPGLYRTNRRDMRMPGRSTPRTGAASIDKAPMNKAPINGVPINRAATNSAWGVF